MTIVVSVLWESDCLVIDQAAPRSGDVGDWIANTPEPSRGDPGWIWMLTLQRPEAFYRAQANVEDDINPDWTGIHLDIELLTTAPGDDPDPGFTHVAEVSVVGPAALNADDNVVDVTDTAPGAYRLRLCTTPAQIPTRLLIQSWPADVSSPRLVRGPLEPAPPPEDPRLSLPELPAGVAAAARIGNDIDNGPGARTLSGQRGTAHATITAPGTPRWHNDWFEGVAIRTPNPGVRSPNFFGVWVDKVYWDTCTMRSPAEADHIIGWNGAVWSRLHPDDKPNKCRMYWWRWVYRTPPEEGDWSQGIFHDPVLPHDTLVVVHLDRVPGTPAHTTITLEHRDVPIEWIDDLTDWWTLQLAIIAMIPQDAYR